MKAGKSKQAISYILTTGYTPASYQLPLQREYQDRDGKGLRKVVYIRGGHSKWAEDYPNLKELKQEILWFEHGRLNVAPEDELLQGIIESHNKYGIDFIVDDPEAKAKEALAKFEKRTEVRKALDELEDYGALADALSYKYESTVDKSEAELKLKCYEEADLNPDRVLAAIQDPMTSTRYLVTLAMSRGVLATNGSRTSIIWASTGDEILPLPKGKMPQDVLPEFLFSPGGESTFTEIAKLVDQGYSQRGASASNSKKSTGKKS